MHRAFTILHSSSYEEKNTIIKQHYLNYNLCLHFCSLQTSHRYQKSATVFGITLWESNIHFQMANSSTTVKSLRYSSVKFWNVKRLQFVKHQSPCLTLNVQYLVARSQMVPLVCSRRTVAKVTWSSFTK